MTPPLPPPGPERDAEIARLLGHPGAARWIEGKSSPTFEPYSTDPAACDRLVEEMVRRGRALQHDVTPYSAGLASVAIIYRARFTRLDGDSLALPWRESGIDRPDAVSAAALLALRARPALHRIDESGTIDQDGPAAREVTALLLGGPSDGHVVPVGSFLTWRALADDGSVWPYSYRGRRAGDRYVFELDDEDAVRWPWCAVAMLARRSGS